MVVPPNSSMRRLSSASGNKPEDIKAASNKFDLEIVFKLTLSNRGLQSISALDQCINLVDLNLSGNAITKMQGMEALVQLRRLNLSGNKITQIDGIWHMTTLESLYLQGNQIQSIASLSLSNLKALPALRALYLQNIDQSQQNPVCRQPGYRAGIIEVLPLSNLDGERCPLTGKYAELATEANQLVRNPPGPWNPKLPDVAPWFEGTPSESVGPPTVDPEVVSKAQQLSTRIDDVRMMDTVLAKELAKVQQQITESRAAV